MNMFRKNLGKCNKNNYCTPVWLATFLLLLCVSSAQAYTDLYRLVWTEDPATTMTIGWRQGSGTFTEVRYRLKGGYSAWQSNAVLTQYNYQNLVNGTDDVLNNSFVNLTGLQPDSDYEFQVCDSNGCTERFMWFRTAPAVEKPVTFIAGGDSRRETSTNFSRNDQARKTGFKLVAKMRPLFVLFSGDFMNNGTFEEWLIWLDEWQLTQSNDGRMYPIVPTHGNHENDVLDMMQQIFNVAGPAGNLADGTYSALSFGGEMLRIWTLNTELEPSVGYSAFESQSSAAWNAQTAWLTADLASHDNVTWKLANYHRPLRPHTSGKSEGNLRYSEWSPLFDQHDLDLAIESDSHMVKYTKPVRPSSAGGADEGFIEADVGNGEHGTVFIGEGSWGAPKRPIDDDKTWTLISNSFWQFKHITVAPTSLDIRTVRFENYSYPAGVDVAVESLTQAAQDSNPAVLPMGLDLWQPFEGDGPLQLPFTDSYTIKTDAGTVITDEESDVTAPEGALFFASFTGAAVEPDNSINTSYGAISQYSVACVDAPWYVFSGSSGAKVSANGYSPGSPVENCDNWLMLPAQDLSATAALTLRFDSDYNFTGPELEVKYSSNYDPQVNADPSSATWTDLDWVKPAAAGYSPMTNSGPVVIDASAIPVAQRNNVTIAYRYTTNGREAGDGRIWEIDNIVILDGSQTASEPGSEDFGSATLGIWQQVNLASPAVWSAGSFGGEAAAGVNNSGQFSAADDWLVSPAFAIPADASALDFSFKTRFSGSTNYAANDNLQLLLSANCSLQGTYTVSDINATSWTLLRNAFTGGENTWTEQTAIDMSSYAGQTVCLAFRYRDDAGFVKPTREWAVDDLYLGDPPVVVNDTVPAKPADTFRIATFNTLLANRGAGNEPVNVYDPSIDPDALLDDLATGNDSQAKGVAEIIQRINPDVILLNEFDWDANEQAIASFKSLYLEVAQSPDTSAVSYPYHYVAISNTGVQPETEGEADCDFNDSAVGCGASGSANDNPEDAYGFGYYPGAFGIVVLSKHPIDTANIRSFRKFLWQDMPANTIPNAWYDSDELDIFRVSSKSHWDIPVLINGETVHVLASHPTPPVFDGTEDRNGRRNHDEIRLWEDYVSRVGDDCYLYTDADIVNKSKSCLGYGRRFVMMGDQNADPVNGDSFASAILQVLNNPVVDDSFEQQSNGGEGLTSGRAATADFGLRADYVVPSQAGLTIRMDSCDLDDPGLSCGIFWPRAGDPKRALTGSCSESGPGCASSDHRLVWLDLEIIADSDGDAIPDDVDNCAALVNTDQLDFDRDLAGDNCDADDDNDQIPDTWEITYGLDPLNPLDASLDNDFDGATNIEEFNRSSNPTVADINPNALDEDIPFLPVWALSLLALGVGWLGRKKI